MEYLKRAIERIKKEPVLVSYTVALVISLAAGFGFNLDPEVVLKIDTALSFGAAVFARQKVTPVARLREMPVHELADEFATALIDDDEAA